MVVIEILDLGKETNWKEETKTLHLGSPGTSERVKGTRKYPREKRISDWERLYLWQMCAAACPNQNAGSRDGMVTLTASWTGWARPVYEREEEITNSIAGAEGGLAMIFHPKRVLEKFAPGWPPAQTTKFCYMGLSASLQLFSLVWKLSVYLRASTTSGSVEQRQGQVPSHLCPSLLHCQRQLAVEDT